MVQRIQSLSNPQLKRLKRLHSVESKHEEFLVEGTHLLTEALAVSWPLRGVYYTQQWAIENRLLIERIKTETKPEIIRNQLILLGRMLRNAPDHDGQESSTSVDVASIPFARRGGSPMLIPSTNRP